MPEPAGRRTERDDARDRGGVPDATPGHDREREEELSRHRARARLRERALERARERAPARETEGGPAGRHRRATGAPQPEGAPEIPTPSAPDTEGPAGPESDAERRRRRAAFLRELTEAKELRARVQPRRARAARMRQQMRMRTFRW
ncbi:hypothetical protein WP39_14115 [Streptomyces sp. 604F]|nr:hypothetical protein [Streptomyces sp. 604F]QHV86359.1 hypothetical protein C3K23_16875 [Streptomyces sp. 604F]RWZ72245.1 hypothetical protein EQK42_30850 [Streptomyces albidoflavus]